MKITRRFTQSGQDPFASVEYEKRTSRIANQDDSLMIAALFDQREREDDLHAPPFPVFLGD